MQEFERYRLIEQYLNDELSSSERARFEERIAQDPTLAEEVELYALTNSVVFESRLLDVKQKMQSNFPSNDNNTTGLNKYIVPVIVGISLLASIGAYVYYSKEDVAVIQKDAVTEQMSNTEPEHAKTQDAEDIENASASRASNAPTNSATTNTANQINTSIPTKTDSVTAPKVIVAPPIKKQATDSVAPTNKTTPTQPKEKLDPCASTSIKTEFKLTPTCTNAATGEIQILLSKTTGGKAPYSYAINNESFGMESFFNELKKGTYTIHVKDQNNCTQLFLKEIKEVTCVQALDDYSFNPNRGQTWKYENKTMTAAHIQILDKSGTLLKTYTVAPNQQIEWDGKSEQGNDLQMGGYICLISYDNGSVEKGMIIIYQ